MRLRQAPSFDEIIERIWEGDVGEKMGQTLQHQMRTVEQDISSTNRLSTIHCGDISGSLSGSRVGGGISLPGSSKVDLEGDGSKK